MIDKEGVYDIPIAEYLADPCCEPSFSASIGKTIMQFSPKHAWMAHPQLGGSVEERNAKADFGSVVHELVLGQGSQYRIIDPADHPNKDGSAPQKENSAMKAAKAEAIAAGLIPISPETLERAEGTAKAIRTQLGEVFAEGEAEKTLIWRDDSIWCRARPDWMVRSANMVFDLKITGVNISPLENAIQRHIFSEWFDLSVAHYTDGYRVLFGEELEYRFLFVEARPPFSIRPFKISGQGLEMGARKLRAARALWKRGVRENRWPGVPLALEVADPEPWHAAGWLTYDAAGVEYETALEMHKPLERSLAQEIAG